MFNVKLRIMNAEKKELLRVANEKILKILNDEVMPLIEKPNNFYKMSKGLECQSYGLYPLLMFNGNDCKFHYVTNDLEDKIIEILES